MTAPPDRIARSTAGLAACGFTVLALAPPGRRATWHLAACAGSMPGGLLVAVLAELPDPLSSRLAMPGGRHPAWAQPPAFARRADQPGDMLRLSPA